MKKTKGNGKIKCLDCGKTPCACNDMPAKMVKGMKKGKAMVKGKIKKKSY